MQNSAQVHKDWSADAVSCFCGVICVCGGKDQKVRASIISWSGISGRRQQREPADGSPCETRATQNSSNPVSSPPAGRVAFPEARSCIVPVGVMALPEGAGCAAVALVLTLSLVSSSSRRAVVCGGVSAAREYGAVMESSRKSSDASSKRYV